MVCFLKLYGLRFKDLSTRSLFFQHNGMIVRAFDAGLKEDDIELLERERVCVCICVRERDSEQETETGVVFVTLG